jgi:hypothetical protein
MASNLPIRLMFVSLNRFDKSDSLFFNSILTKRSNWKILGILDSY